MKRIQRSRKKGSKLPPGTVCVTRPGPWGNPFCEGVQIEPFMWGSSAHGSKISDFKCSRSAAIELFRIYALNRMKREPNWLLPLLGKDLACWCPLDMPCHADVLIELTATQE